VSANERGYARSHGLNVLSVTVPRRRASAEALEVQLLSTRAPNKVKKRGRGDTQARE
jgi:hypothetical protein